MRQARDWYFLEFNPQSMADFTSAMFSDHSGHLRMVITYWDMAAGLVTSGDSPKAGNTKCEKSVEEPGETCRLSPENASGSEYLRQDFSETLQRPIPDLLHCFL